MLKTPKKKGGKRKKDHTRDGDDDDDDDAQKGATAEPETERDPDDPLLSTPMPRYNAMLAVLRSTLYMHVPTTPYSHKAGTNIMTSYGGIFERGSREYTLDDFHSLALDKMDRFVCLKKSDVTVPLEGDDVSSSEEDDDDDGDDTDEDEEDGDDELSGEEEAPEIKEAEEEAMTEPVGATLYTPCCPLMASETEVSLRDQATAFLGVSKDTKRSEEDIISTPLPGETLAVFYSRSRKFSFSILVTGDWKSWLLTRMPFFLSFPITRFFLAYLQVNIGLRRRARVVTTEENFCGAMAFRSRKRTMAHISLSWKRLRGSWRRLDWTKMK